MSESSDKKDDKKKTLSLKGGTLSLKGGAPKSRGSSGGAGTVVEVRRRRSTPKDAPMPSPSGTGGSTTDRHLTDEEREARARALKTALSGPTKKAERDSEIGKKVEHKPEKIDTTGMSEDEARAAELAELQRIEAEEAARAAEADRANQSQFQKSGFARKEEEGSYRDRLKRAPTRAPKNTNRRNSGKMTVTQVLNQDYERDRSMSLAAQKRARDKARKAAMGPKEPAQKVYREVTIPEFITVQELAGRMTERGPDVIKALMKNGIMATINQTIDADTAELIVMEFGHKIKRVSEADIEEGLSGLPEDDDPSKLAARPPVVTIMGHVDHGKTSLLDAMRKTDVVSGEAGGITQHIGAYQIEKDGQKITFLDTPGHAAFTEMRARGANVTDIVIIVVAANDSIMPQTIEAINHAKAAEVPIIVAINKIDLPDANPMKVKQDLLTHEVIVEEMGGEVQAIEISAMQKTNLDKLEEAILLQSEVLELQANPDKQAQAVVVEAKMETGRGSVATVLVQSGTLKKGDIFVVGAETGRVRTLIDDQGAQVDEAEPGKPVEVLGLNGTPEAGDVLNVVDSDARAREITDYRQRVKREKQAAATSTAGKSFEDLLAASKEAGEKQILPVVIKADVHGSVEAIIGSLEKMTEDNAEIGVQVLHSGVGGITESDITLANASGALVIGFNVRANAQAREQATRDGVDIRYYNIIYNVIDDAKAILSGMLSPTEREEYLGQAEIRQVFNITKVGKVAGCMVTLGNVKRGARVRLLRDDVVIHDNGVLKTLKRHKDEVKEVKEGMECGMAFENYDDIKEGDIIECFDVIEEARQLD